MKFCNKCHKMIMKKMTNPNNLFRYCNCKPNSNEEVFISKDVACRMRAVAPCITLKNARKTCMGIARNIKYDE